MVYYTVKSLDSHIPAPKLPIYSVSEMNPDDKILLYHNDGSRVLGKSFQYLDKETNLKLQILKLLILQRWYRQYSNTLFFLYPAHKYEFSK